MRATQISTTGTADAAATQTAVKHRAEIGACRPWK